MVLRGTSEACQYNTLSSLSHKLDYLLQVDGMNASRLGGCKRQYIVASRANGENDIVRFDIEKASIDAAVLPGKCVNILVIELRVLWQLLVVIYPPVVILIPACRKRKLVIQIDNSRLVRLGPVFSQRWSQRWTRTIADL